MNNENLPKEPISFEDALAKLEETIQRLEKGGLTLDDTTRMFEEGLSLARTCNKLLTSAELKVSRLQQDLAEEIALSEDPEYN